MTSFPANDVSKEKNELTDSVGPHHDLTFEDKSADFFFTEDIFQHISDRTNLYARQKQEAKGKEYKNWKADVKDIKAFIAIQIIIGIHQLLEYQMYWSDDDRLREKSRYVHNLA